MRITFRIHYITRWGEQIHIMLGNEPKASLPMTYSEGCWWNISLDMSDDTRQLRYRYLVKTEEGITRIERCNGHTLSLPDDVKHAYVLDHWDDTEEIDNDFIDRLVNNENKKTSISQSINGKVAIEAIMPNLGTKNNLAVVGNSTQLGEWNVHQALQMSPCGNSKWRAVIDVSQDQMPIEYKLIIVASGRRREVVWECGDNRRLEWSPRQDEALMIPGLRFRHHGSAMSIVATWINVADLRSERDVGAGDLGDIKKLLQWASATGQQAVVLDSLTDHRVVDGWMPARLREIVTENAIDPVFINLTQTGALADKKLMAQFHHSGMELNALNVPDMEKVRSLKLDYTRAVHEQSGLTVKRTSAYRRFIDDNAVWLRPYAAQAILQRVNKGADIAVWGNYSSYDASQVEKFLKARQREYSFTCFLQYHLRQQLMAAASFATSKRLKLSCGMTCHHQVKLIDIKEPWVNQRFIEQRLHGMAGYTLIPLRDWLIIDGSFLPRIAQMASSRLPVTLEEMVASHQLLGRIKTLIANR